VRVIEYTVHSTPIDPDTGEPDPTAEERSEVFALVTDLLDVAAYPALDLARTYPMRWECEMWALFAVYQALAHLIDAGVDATGLPAAAISFPNALAAATDTHLLDSAARITELVLPADR